MKEVVALGGLVGEVNEEFGAGRHAGPKLVEG